MALCLQLATCLLQCSNIQVTNWSGFLFYTGVVRKNLVCLFVIAIITPLIKNAVSKEAAEECNGFKLVQVM